MTKIIQSEFLKQQQMGQMDSQEDKLQVGLVTPNDRRNRVPKIRLRAINSLHVTFLFGGETLCQIQSSYRRGMI
jgi:hypothetical protein